jgi:hypothetical protein
MSDCSALADTASLKTSAAVSRAATWKRMRETPARLD